MIIPMKFITIKEAIVSILENNSTYEGNKIFNVFGSRKQKKGSSEIEGIGRIVVYYQSGRFPEQTGNYMANKIHEAVYRFELTIVENAKVDLSILNDDDATPEQKKNALIAMFDASDIADQKMDELFQYAYQILEDPRNYEFGLAKGFSSNRKIDNFEKGDPLPQGESAVLVASFDLTVRMNEDVDGETPTDGSIYDNSISLKDDPNNNLGVETINEEEV